MSALQFLGKVYSLDTLDTRFTTSSRTPPSATNAARSTSKESRDERGSQRAQDSGASPSKWKTPEFFYHYLVFLIAVPCMFYTVYNVSQPWNPEYSKFESLLSAGWIPGRKVDNSDAQYASFRDNVPYLFVVMALHPLLRRAFDAMYGSSSGKKDHNGHTLSNGRGAESAVSHMKADERQERRLSFDFMFNLGFLVALHGFSAPKVLIILYINFLLATKLDRRYIPAATWIFNIGILFANELGQGYRYSMIANILLPEKAGDVKDNGGWGSFLDGYGGLIPRWEVLFNITVLRLISFNFDYYWARNRSGSNSPVEKQLDVSNLSERDRVDLPAKSQDYSFRNYLAYALYAPLYLAGPILTFNDYISQQRHTPKSITQKRTIAYGVRFLLALLAMEVMIHYIYVVAISKAQPAWGVYSPLQLSMLGYFNLHHIWLKLLLPWRFFRLWALVDSIDPPENVVRCMSDNYSAFGFWRGWHRSYNRWLIRYIYIPLGGSSVKGAWGTVRSMLNLFIVFSFVAMWHDIQLRLLVWGWLISLFILPEVIAGFLFPQSKWQGHKEAYRVICGIGAVGNILMMMSANLVGFAVGLDGLQGLVQGIVGSWSGLGFLFAACCALFTGAQVMFELRQQELRDGINMKC